MIVCILFQLVMISLISLMTSICNFCDERWFYNFLAFPEITESSCNTSVKKSSALCVRSDSYFICSVFRVLLSCLSNLSNGWVVNWKLSPLIRLCIRLVLRTEISFSIYWWLSLKILNLNDEPSSLSVSWSWCLVVYESSRKFYELRGPYNVGERICLVGELMPGWGE